jgi:lipopolysaccharide biosynthesis protein
LPADLGFYDLRLAEVRAAQAQLARKYGIYGFCYYHYWFNGRRVLQRPLDEVLSSGEPDFPFCVCWANENWTRRWDGQESEVLLKQNYSRQDDIDHIRSLIPTFKDPRYIKIEGKPLFLVYRASNLPDPSASIRVWRQEVEGAGMPGLYVCCVESFVMDHGLSTKIGADAAVEFAPDWTCLPSRIAVNRPFRFLQKRLIRGVSKHNHICEYADLAERMLDKPPVDYRRFRCVTPMWDNAARRKRDAFIARDSTPERYEYWLREVIKQELKNEGSNHLVFINAWNEWAEGNHLEPCERWGTAYLEATLRAASFKPS